jgi:hypothetical protein
LFADELFKFNLNVDMDWVSLSDLVIPLADLCP